MYHIVWSHPLDLAVVVQEAAAHTRPRLAMGQLAARLNARLHMPEAATPSSIDRICARFISTPEIWAWARALSARWSCTDVVYCGDEGVGIPLAFACANNGSRPRLVVCVHNLDRPRGRAALALFRPSRVVDLFIANCQWQARFLKDYMNVPTERVRVRYEQTDVHFFTPAPQTRDKGRPIIVSAGNESRDFETLAAATHDLPVEVRLTGLSSAAAKTLDRLPANFSRRFYDWCDLVQLYRASDVAAICLRPVKFAAGVTALLEMLACRRPVVVTQTLGLEEYSTSAGAALVPPRDAAALRAAITRLLDNPTAAAAQAERGYQYCLAHHGSEPYVEELARTLELLAPRAAERAA